MKQGLELEVKSRKKKNSLDGQEMAVVRNGDKELRDEFFKLDEGRTPLIPSAYAPTHPYEAARR